ncbi:MAG: hypothetical protein HY298_23130 [Verrucomicrobia bacterium]|nr:hypothetical protein [Verrucomicrobiota bacterium]
MKISKMLLAVVVVATLVLAALVFRGRQPHSTEAAVESPQPVEASAPLASSPVDRVVAKPVAAPVATPARPAGVALPATPIQSVNLMRVSATQVLGRVNGKLIQLKDLVPVQPGETEKSMTPEQYQSRLERAIEAELVFQEAGRQAVGLTPQQQQRLDKIAQDHAATLEEYKKQGISWSSVGAAQLEFEKRLLSAQMLQQNLVVKKAAVVPSPEPEMQSRYEQARRELLGQLRAGANITETVPAL